VKPRPVEPHPSPGTAPQRSRGSQQPGLPRGAQPWNGLEISTTSASTKSRYNFQHLPRLWIHPPTRTQPPTAPVELTSPKRHLCRTASLTTRWERVATWPQDGLGSGHQDWAAVWGPFLRHIPAPWKGQSPYNPKPGLSTPQSVSQKPKHTAHRRAGRGCGKLRKAVQREKKSHGARESEAARQIRGQSAFVNRNYLSRTFSSVS
jgi:hypothetical protein